jgi:hypothetical protein
LNYVNFTRKLCINNLFVSSSKTHVISKSLQRDIIKIIFANIVFAFMAESEPRSAFNLIAFELTPIFVVMRERERERFPYQDSNNN